MVREWNEDVWIISVETLCSFRNTHPKGDEMDGTKCGRLCAMLTIEGSDGLEFLAGFIPVREEPRLSLSASLLLS